MSEDEVATRAPEHKEKGNGVSRSGRRKKTKGDAASTPASASAAAPAPVVDVDLLRKEGEHFRRQVKTQLQIIKQQKEAIEQYAAKLKELQTSLSSRDEELRDAQAEIGALRAELESDAKKREAEQGLNEQQSATIEAEVERRLEARLQVERNKWEIGHNIELSAIQDFKKTEQEFRAQKSKFEEERRLYESKKQDDSTLSQMSAAERALYKLKQEQKQHDADSEKAPEGSDGDATLEEFNDNSPEEVEKRAAANKARLSRAEGTIIVAKKEVASIREIHDALRHQAMMFKAAVRKIDVIRESAVKAIEKDAAEKRELQNKLNHVTKFLRKM